MNRALSSKGCIIEYFKESAVFFGDVVHLHYHTPLVKFTVHTLGSNILEEWNNKKYPVSGLGRLGRGVKKNVMQEKKDN